MNPINSSQIHYNLFESISSSSRQIDDASGSSAKPPIQTSPVETTSDPFLSSKLKKRKVKKHPGGDRVKKLRGRTNEKTTLGKRKVKQLTTLTKNETERQEVRKAPLSLLNFAHSDVFANCIVPYLTQKEVLINLKLLSRSFYKLFGSQKLIWQSRFEQDLLPSAFKDWIITQYSKRCQTYEGYKAIMNFNEKFQNREAPSPQCFRKKNVRYCTDAQDGNLLIVCDTGLKNLNMKTKTFTNVLKLDKTIEAKFVINDNKLIRVSYKYKDKYSVIDIWDLSSKKRLINGLNITLEPTSHFIERIMKIENISKDSISLLEVLVKKGDSENSGGTSFGLFKQTFDLKSCTFTPPVELDSTDAISEDQTFMYKNRPKIQFDLKDGYYLVFKKILSRDFTWTLFDRNNKSIRIFNTNYPGVLPAISPNKEFLALLISRDIFVHHIKTGKRYCLRLPLNISLNVLPKPSLYFLTDSHLVLFGSNSNHPSVRGEYFNLPFFSIYCIDKPAPLKTIELADLNECTTYSVQVLPSGTIILFNKKNENPGTTSCLVICDLFAQAKAYLERSLLNKIDAIDSLYEESR